MRLADFIERAEEAILQEAVAFARSLEPLTDTDEDEIRDHIPQMLRAVSEDLRTRQSQAASIAKSHGLAAAASRLTEADVHGLQRARKGLSIEHLLAEYRALRASVLRLWTRAHPVGPEAVEDILRFDEAIDQAIAESVRAYALETEKRRQLFLAALGHDLRGPLNALALTAAAVEMEAPPKLGHYVKVLSRSTQRMSSLLGSLLEYNLVGLGGRMTLTRAFTDLDSECREEVQILRAALPDTTIHLAIEGDCTGDFDVSRVREAMGNLISNAARHGVRSQPVGVRLQGMDDAVSLSVTNAVEEPIPQDELSLLFEPMRRRDTKGRSAERTNLGLGLFITREIAKAHGGEVTGTCEGHLIRFTLSLPRGDTATREAAS